MNKKIIISLGAFLIFTNVSLLPNFVVQAHASSKNITEYTNASNLNEKEGRLSVGQKPQLTRLLKVTNPLMYGYDVEYVQKVLRNLGYKLRVDGYYGNETKNTVIRFQKSKRLDPDGIVGPLTFKALIS
ncbi:peptidoglycan-binding domain-containing protein [Clostridium sardiniense]|uniref:peptidoglycan-binding domain-containing protein n=1 Tax=Clostridium sardiniense TaxID=29369 RepID=UPI001FAF6F6C|nr:peptidoglycan-binding protein [Clostridium sardiniense]MBM7836305.1 peptidoglycan hydrolase-like protein with peptidoglycan-binding domain [Clostridium sardiniense]